MKIKKVEIENFRGYEGKQEFNFINEKNNEIADLIVIFAPNGFGKTSFTDSVEWAFTGHIKRLDKSDTVQLAYTNEKKQKSNKLYLLKNTNSNAISGKVKIVNENDKIMEASTKILKGLMNYDYDIKKDNRDKPYKDNEFEKITENEFLSNNLVTSDDVNSFLQFDDPEKRFEILKTVWDETNDTKFYGQINKLHSEIKKEIENIEKNIKVNQKDIDAFGITQKDIDSLNQLILKVNNSFKKNILNEINNITFKDINKQILIEEETREKIEINALNDSIKKINRLFDDFLDYERNLNETIQLKKEKEVFYIKKDINVNENKKTNLLFINNYKNNFLRKNDDMKRIKKIIDNQILGKSEILEKSEGCLEKIKMLNQSTTLLEKDIEILEKKIPDLDKKIKKYNYDKEIKIKVENRKRLVNLIINRYKDKEFEKESVLINVDRINDSFEKLYKSDENVLEKESIKISKIKNKINDYIDDNEILRKSEKEYEIAKEIIFKQKEKIEKLFTISFDVLKEEEIKNCPLCNTDFKDSKLLFSIINENAKNIGLVFSEEENKRKEKIEKLKLNLKDKENIIRNEIKSIYEQEKKALFTYKNRVKKFSDVFSALELKDSEINKSYTSILKIINELKIDNKEIDICMVEELNKRKEYLNNNKKTIEGDINTLKNNFKNLDLNIKIKENEINKSKEEIESIKTEENQIKIISILKELGIKLENEEDFLVLQEKMKESEENLVKLQDKLNKYNELNEVYSINEFNIEEIERHLLELEKWNKMYEETGQEFFKEIKDYDIEIDNIKKLQVEYINRINEKEEKLKAIEELAKGIQILGNKGLIENKRNENEKLKLKKHIYKNEKLKEVNIIKIEAEKIIKKKIDTAFNLEVINNIYQMINPHPDLKEISFTPNFEKSKPVIHISAIKNEEKVSPILYFSSAQVSILALSIFFAKALQSDNGLDTIFLDDPVQHLDSINTLAFIDLLRNIIVSKEVNKQIVLTTNNQTFYGLLKRKLDDEYYNSKFIELESYGKIKN